jgi:TPR repeat protein
MYKTGRGVAQDLPEAIRLLEMATERMGDSSTLANFFNDPTKHSYLEVLLVVLGKMLVTKLVGGGPAEGDSAFDFHREALVLAQDGVPSAQFLSGLLYLGGEAIEKNMTEATRWFHKAAEQGHVGAQSILGIVFKTGDGVNQDMVEAARCFQKAADQGDAPAQFHIGFAFLEGEGVEQDTVEAIHWFRKAAEQDFEPAKEILNKMAAPLKNLSEANE